MRKNRYDDFAVKIEYRSRYGSGVCCQMGMQGEICLVTAAHCILGNELQEEAVELSEVQFFRQNDGKIEPFEVQIREVYFVKDRDLCVFMGNVQREIACPVLGEVQNGETVFVCGFPHALASEDSRYKRYNLRGVVNEFPEQGIIQLQMSTSLETYTAQAMDTIGGMSGSGIYVERGYQIYLVGILTDLSAKDGAFNSVLGTETEVLRELLEQNGYSVNVPKIAERFRSMPNIRKGSYHYEISDTIISRVREDGNQNDGASYSYGACMEWLVNDVTSCIQILGEGGAGKTSFLLKAAEYAEQQFGIKAQYIWLNEYQGQLTEEVEKGSQLLLLDGFNELPETGKREVALQIKYICNNTDIKIVIASRRKVDGSAGLYGVKAFYMEKLQNEQITAYLREQGADAEQAAAFWELLRNPMMLTVYTQTSIEMQNNKEVEYFRFYDTCHNRGELIFNYLESLAAKQYMQCAGQEWAMQELVMAFYVMHFMLPEIASGMECNKKFVLSQEGLYGEIERVLHLQQEDWNFIKRWFEKREITEIESLKQLDVPKVLSYLRNFPTIFYKEKDWRFTHHNFRDGLAAMNAIWKFKKGIAMQQIPDALYQPMSEELMEFISELSGKDNSAGATEIMDEALNLLRGKEAEEIRLPLYHILQIKRKKNANLAGTDFRNIDLKGQILEPYIDGKNGTIKTDFSGAVIYPENLIPVGHASRVTKVCYSPDGKRIATASDDGVVWLWNAHTVQPEQKLETGETSFCSGLKISPDNTLLAMANFQAVYVWNIENGQCLFVMEDFAEIVEQIVFHPSGMELATADQSGTICIWDMRTGEENFRLCANVERKHVLSKTIQICYSPDGSHLAAGYENGYVKIWSSENGQCLKTFESQNNGIRNIKYSPDGKRLAIASAEAAIVVLDAESGEIVWNLEGHARYAFRLEFSPDGKYLATASADDTARIWNMETGVCSHVLEAHEDVVQLACFHPSGKYLATAGCDGLVAIWDVDTGNLIHRLEKHRDIVGAIAFSPEGENLVTASLDENVYVWNVMTGKIKHLLKCNGRRINEFQITRDGKLLTVDCPEQTARIWDIFSKKCVWKKEQVSYEFAFHPEGSFCVNREDGEQIQVIHTKTGQVMWQTEMESRIWRIICSPNITYVAVVLASGEVKVFLAETGELILALQKDKKEGLIFSPDERFLAVNGEHRIQIWDCMEKDWWSEYEKATEGYAEIHFSADSRYLIVQDWRSNIYFMNLYETEDGIVRANANVSRDLFYIRKQPFFATVDRENVIKTWDYETGEIRCQIKLEDGEIRKTVYDVNGERAAVLYYDGTIVVTDIVGGRILKTLQAPDSSIWNIAFGMTSDTLLLPENAVLHCLNWEMGQDEIVIDQRYEERLKGCKLQEAQFSEEMKKEDIRLLKNYG